MDEIQIPVSNRALPPISASDSKTRRLDKIELRHDWTKLTETQKDWLRENGWWTLPVPEDILAVQNWVRRVFLDPPDLLLQEKHVDEFVPSFDPRFSVGLTLHLYHALLEAVNPLAADVMAMAIFPLGYSTDLLADIPVTSDLQSVVDPDESPSLYLASRRFQVSLKAGEIYRRDLPQDEVVARSGVVRAVYQVMRTEKGVQEEWEYARSVHFEHYPADLVWGS